MPYIKKDRRKVLKPLAAVAETSGELNYQISYLLNEYMLKHGLSYDRMDDCTGACGDAAAEFRRRIMNGYEDQKIEDNGDVYTCLGSNG